MPTTTTKHATIEMPINIINSTDPDALSTSVKDGSTSGRLITDLFSTSTGKLDDIADGAVYGKTKLTVLSSGAVDFASTDMLNRSATYVSEASTRKWAAESGAQVTSGKSLTLLVDVNLDNIADGASYGRVKESDLFANRVKQIWDQAGSRYVTGTNAFDKSTDSLDDVTDGPTYGRVKGAGLSSGEVVRLGEGVEFSSGAYLPGGTTLYVGDASTAETLTKTVYLQAAQFLPAGSGISWEWVTGWLHPNGAGTQSYIGPVVLPVGVEVTGVGVHAYRNSTSDTVEILFQAGAESTWANLLASTIYSSTGWGDVASSTLSHTVSSGETLSFLVNLTEDAAAGGGSCRLGYAYVTYRMASYDQSI